MGNNRTGRKIYNIQVGENPCVKILSFFFFFFLTVFFLSPLRNACIKVNVAIQRIYYIGLKIFSQFTFYDH